MKRYVHETGSEAVRKLLNRTVVATSRLSDVEVASAIVRRAREGMLDTRQRDQLLAHWTRDLSRYQVIEVAPVITTLARQLLLRHTLRASDAIQLASGMIFVRELQLRLDFVSFDSRLSAAAAAEGLTPVP